MNQITRYVSMAMLLTATMGSQSIAQDNSEQGAETCFTDEITNVLLEHRMQSTRAEFNEWPVEKQDEVTDVAEAITAPLEAAYEAGGFSQLAIVMSIALPANTASHYLTAWKHCYPDRLELSGSSD